MNTGKILFITIFALFCIETEAQKIESWVEANSAVPVEKIYLHTDREYYVRGETIWFKIYLTDSRSGRLIPGAENIYLNLTDKNGEVVLKQLIMSSNGLAHGNIELPVTLNPGKYHLHAFTDYLLSIGKQSFYRQSLQIHSDYNSFATPDENIQQQNNNPYFADISFLPGGGRLLENTSNLVAFKAIDQNGYGTNVSGQVVDEKGVSVATFKTDYQGLGLFFLTPEKGKSYTAKISGFPSFSYSFDSIVECDGIKIQLINHTNTELIVNIRSNSNHFKNDTFYLANMHRGEVIFYQPVKIESQNHVLKFKNQMLRGGINRLVLLNKNLNPVSERLVFSKNYQLLSLDISTDSAAYQKQSEVKLKIGSTNESKKYLSIAVVQKNAFPERGISRNILSYFLIDSELNGLKGHSEDFFTDAEISSDAKLQLLMLTHSGNRYFWNGVPKTIQPAISRSTAGINLQGTARNSFTEKPLKNGEITLIIEKDNEMAFLTQKTDEKGEFTFPGIVFSDTAKILIQAKNEKGRQNTEIVLQPVIKTVEMKHEEYSSATDFSDAGEKPIIRNDAANQLEYSGNLINENNRAPAKKEPAQEPDDGRFRIYNTPDHVIEIPENETTTGNLLDYLSGKVAGVDVNSNQVRIRGTSHFEGSSMPLFLIDGVPLSPVTDQNLPDEIRNVSDVNAGKDEYILEAINSIPLRDIEKVEILKSPQNLAAFGTEGANGVIAIYTRRGDNIPETGPAKGIIWQNMVGYSSAQKFLPPNGNSANGALRKPAISNTLFWDADVELQAENYENTFFTSDQPGDYLIVVEGISEDGKLCTGTATFSIKSNE